ncbi:hypothetical protein QQP08_013928 [Theobroma cacao]|uniref:Uncharacterized protein n=1 Tax=Theobroma cacao TaxID=3641 RepID=A0A061EPJ8_THECC|nr:Uncharacterized protein TCM_021259 [Theobroma cacao]WRX21441.1 hypothetical protein QQP08_013928 [Theobroma cacao]
MASQREQNLKKVGLEGFGLIDECYGRTRRSNHQSQRLQSPQPQVYQSHYQYFYYQHQQSYVCQVPQVYTVTKEPAVTSYHGTTSQHQYYGGQSISERPQVVSVAKEAVVSSNEAAKFYGGTMVIDYTSRNKPLFRAYY